MAAQVAEDLKKRSHNDATLLWGNADRRKKNSRAVVHLELGGVSQGVEPVPLLVQLASGVSVVEGVVRHAVRRVDGVAVALLPWKPIILGHRMEYGENRVGWEGGGVFFIYIFFFGDTLLSSRVGGGEFIFR